MDASIDDIYKLPFMKMLIRVNAEIIPLRASKET